MPLTVTGGCLCGEIRYESEAVPYLVGYCHCKMCQKGLGNCFGAAAFFRRSTFRFTSGTLKGFQSPTATRSFCPSCGSPVAFQRLGFEDKYCAIWLGTLDDPAAFEPTVQWHTESRIPWVEPGADLGNATPTGSASRYDAVAGA